MSENSLPSAARPRLSWPHILLSLVGAYLSYDAIRAHALVKAGQDSGCGVTETINCDKVLASEYAEIFGIPLGVYGLVYFAVVALTAISTEADFSPRRWRLIQLALAAAGICSSLALTYISKVVIGSYCSICLKVHATTTTLFLLSLFLWWRARKQSG
jgi:uncharacterized membrane protein